MRQAAGRYYENARTMGGLTNALTEPSETLGAHDTHAILASFNIAQ